MIINKVYTRTGDDGQTTLTGGTRVSKDSLRVEAYGTVDELQSQLGLLMALSPEAQTILAPVQEKLFLIGSSLSGKDYPAETLDAELTTLPLEQSIDELQEGLEKLRAFVEPGGSVPAALAHVARTVCRRAERRIISLARQEQVAPQVIAYMNRLSDLLFVLARHLNYVDNRHEKKWENTCE